jgi:hypothetical protein
LITEGEQVDHKVRGISRHKKRPSLESGKAKCKPSFFQTAALGET